MARPNPLNDPEYAARVAEAFAAGLDRQEMADIFGVKDLDTISRWRKHPAVRGRAMTIIEDRVLQVHRKVDAVIAERLNEPEKMTNRELLDIRKEFAGTAFTATAAKADDATVNEAMTFLENNAEAAAALEEMLKTGKVPGALSDEDKAEALNG